MAAIHFPSLPYGSVVYVPSKNSCFIAEYDYDQEEYRWSDTSGNNNYEDDGTLALKNRDNVMEVIRVGKSKTQPLKWDIWAEGYAASGDSAGASFHGRDVEAPTFKEACVKTFGTDPLFNAEKLTYWGCRLFDNRHDAQRSFG